MTETSLKEGIPAKHSAPVRRRGGDWATPRRATTWRVATFIAPLAVGWRYREFIVAMLRRELADRFRGSLFGWVWAIVAPLITLAIYTVTFAGALRLPIASMRGGTINYALSTFVGLIVFNL